MRPFSFPVLLVATAFCANTSAFHPTYISSSGEVLNQLFQLHAEKPYKKKKGFSINENFVGSISSDGKVKLGDQAKKSTGSLGVSKRPKKKSKDSASKMSTKDRQRTGNGNVDSSLQSLIADPENENIEVLEAKRGNKTVTIIRGMTSPMDDRKTMLKEMKRAFGVGGTMVDGVLEIQGAYAIKAIQVLKQKGYSKARKIGK